ncbi:MAG: hypothetical protein PHQ33_05815 [Bacteroidales bacterium]|nr:hypothetical protein [Bacteroidales bacterium]MDD4395381.1 hypothetical protein [Bacteroidales bacterium]
MKTKLVFVSLFVAMSALVFIGCEKEELPDENEGTGTSQNLPKLLAAGSDDLGAVCWEDGTATSLGEGFLASANAVFASGNDTYYGGTVDRKPVIWKKSQKQVLDAGSGSVNDLIVTNGNVYAVGQLNNAATLWINGTAQTLTTDYECSPYLTMTSTANAITIVNGKVYIVGGILVGDDRKAIYMWVNGESQRVSDNEGMGYDIAVDGTTVYVVGEAAQPSDVFLNLYVPALWTNGTFIDLTPANQLQSQGCATCVCVDNHIPYVTFYRMKGDIYDNTQQGYLYQNGTSREIACKKAYAVYKKGSDLYVGGTKEQWGGSIIPVIYKNNVAQNLGTVTYPATIKSIFVR